MNENTVTDINKYRAEKLSLMDRYRDSTFRKFVGATALIATLVASPAVIREGKELLGNLSTTQANVYENADETYKYTVRAGDTIGGISERIAAVMDGVQHQQNVEANVVDFNRIDNAGEIKVGESLNLPVDISDVTLDNNR